MPKHVEYIEIFWNAAVVYDIMSSWRLEYAGISWRDKFQDLTSGEGIDEVCDAIISGREKT